MRDRTPTRALENGALRYGVYAEDGSLLRYEYLALEDDPTDPGTELSKATLLQDSTETALFGSAADRTVDEAFSGLAAQIKLIMSNTAAITLTLKDNAGHAIPGVLVQGILSESGQDVYSGTDGVAAGYIAEGSQTIKVTGYADIEDYAEAIAVTKGTTITKALTLTTRNFLKITSSRSVKFSGNVQTVDVTVVGGGGSGGIPSHPGSSKYDPMYLATGGYGGEVVVEEDIVPETNTLYPAVIGAGGPGKERGTSGASAGGQSSFMGKTARGGGVGSDSIQWTYGTSPPSRNGADGTAGYSSFTETAKYGAQGGSGAGGMGNETPGEGGADFGARGMRYSDYNHSDAAANTGSGGGGGIAYWDDDNNPYIQGGFGAGGSGVVTIRMHLKSAA